MVDRTLSEDRTVTSRIMLLQSWNQWLRGVVVITTAEWHRGVVVITTWCSGYHYCTTSFNKPWTQVLRRFKSCSRRVGDSRWWGSLTMAPAGNKAKRLWSVNHATKTIHHHHHHMKSFFLIESPCNLEKTWKKKSLFTILEDKTNNPFENNWSNKNQLK